MAPRCAKILCKYWTDLHWPALGVFRICSEYTSSVFVVSSERLIQRTSCSLAALNTLCVYLSGWTRSPSIVNHFSKKICEKPTWLLQKIFDGTFRGTWFIDLAGGGVGGWCLLCRPNELFGQGVVCKLSLNLRATERDSQES